MSAPNPHEVLDAYLQLNNLKVTQQRRSILDILMSHSRHVTIEELLSLAKVKHPKLGQSTVYRTMKVLVNAGLALEHRFEDGLTRFEYAHDAEHHDHLICNTCSHIFEFENSAIEKLQNEIAASYGLKIVSHELNIYGQCISPNTCEHFKD